MECRLCGGHAEDFVVAGTTYGRCADCDYTGIDPLLLPSAAAEEARYRLHNNSYEDERFRTWIESFLDIAVPFMKPGAAVLDFGSGPEPVPARILATRGFTVTQYDPFFSPGDEWRSRTWDTILVHEVAEHLANPRAVFDELARLLAPGGVLCVRTRFPPENPMEFARWRYRMDSTHVGFFTERCLRLLAKRLNLEPVLVAAPDRAVLQRR
ncbi:MAG: class I SAM-dependent methyltransferase [Spirochaetales bacterium]|nr:class I SAM-dependent methyltransferase [Spirochaetales bacterium]